MRLFNRPYPLILVWFVVIAGMAYPSVAEEGGDAKIYVRVLSRGDVATTTIDRVRDETMTTIVPVVPGDCLRVTPDRLEKVACPAHPLALGGEHPAVRALSVDEQITWLSWMTDGTPTIQDFVALKQYEIGLRGDGTVVWRKRP